MMKKLLLIPIALFFFNGLLAQNVSGFSTEKLLEFNTYIQDEIDAKIHPGPESTGQLYWDGYFRTHFFIDPTLNLIAIFISQKLPHRDDYAIGLNQYAYAALQ
tara:strand:- start:582 stop:890 length:309 start_codon:yes stop_codon:yes gene_type:complete